MPRQRQTRDMRLVVGDKVEVLDTSNQKTLDAYVRQRDGARIQVWVERFKTTMWFEHTGLTSRGRFKLGERIV